MALFHVESYGKFILFRISQDVSMYNFSSLAMSSVSNLCRTEDLGLGIKLDLIVAYLILFVYVSFHVAFMFQCSLQRSYIILIVCDRRKPAPPGLKRSTSWDQPPTSTGSPDVWSINCWHWNRSTLGAQWLRDPQPSSEFGQAAGGQPHFHCS